MASVVIVVFLVLLSIADANLISAWSTIDLFNDDRLPNNGASISINETVYVFGTDEIIKLDTNTLDQLHRIRSNLSVEFGQNIVYSTKQNMIYLVSNANIYAFDTKSDSFISTSHIPPMPIPVYLSCITMDDTNNLLYIFGGIHQNTHNSTSNLLQILSLDSNEWLESVESAPISTSSSSCFISDDLRSFYVFGGTDSDQILR